MTKEVKTGMMAFIILVVAMAVFLFVRPKDWFGGNYFHMTASFSSVQGIKKEMKCVMPVSVWGKCPKFPRKEMKGFLKCV